MRYYLFAGLVLALDQVTKWLVAKYMELGESIPLWEGVFHLTSHRNRGAAFGILQDQRWFFVVITTLIVAGIIFYMYKIARTRPLLSFGLGLILGGALGNFFDRLLFGEVVDFFHFVLINFAIFNVADAAITIGVGFVILDTILDMKKERNQNSEIV